MNFDKFYYIRVPQIILNCGRFTRLQCDVFGAVYADQTMRKGLPTGISLREICRRVGAEGNRSKARGALDFLLEQGVLRRLDDGDLDAIVPDWILSHEKCDRSMMKGGSKLTPGSRGPLPRGPEDPPWGGPEDPPIGVEGVEKEFLSRAKQVCPPTGGEIEVPDPDGGSREAEDQLEHEADERRTRREVRRPRVRRVKGEGEEDPLLRTPSKRPVLNEWRERSGAWRARDVVGWFVCEYARRRGEEPREFFATESRILKHHASNVSKFTRRWLDRDPERAKALAEAILSGADERRLPVILGYYFTPSSEAASLRLADPVRRGRPQAPHERNDARGDGAKNKAHWDERARLADAKRAATKLRREEAERGEADQR